MRAAGTELTTLPSVPGVWKKALEADGVVSFGVCGVCEGREWCQMGEYLHCILPQLATLMSCTVGIREHFPEFLWRCIQGLSDVKKTVIVKKALYRCLASLNAPNGQIWSLLTK